MPALSNNPRNVPNTKKKKAGKYIEKAERKYNATHFECMTSDDLEGLLLYLFLFFGNYCKLCF